MDVEEALARARFLVQENEELRTQLAAVTKEKNEWMMQMGGVVSTLRAELAAVTAERDEWKDRTGYLDRNTANLNAELVSAKNDAAFWKARKYVKGLIELEAELAAAREAVDLLDLMFDAYEDGVICYEDPVEQSVYMGNAVQLDNETFLKIANLLNKLKPRTADNAARSAGQGEG